MSENVRNIFIGFPVGDLLETQDILKQFFKGKKSKKQKMNAIINQNQKKVY